MSIEVLISTMNKTKEELKNMINISNVSDYVVINQITKDDISLTNVNNTKGKIISLHDKGLSKSRNLAIKNSTSDVCVIADDDMYYEENYVNIIQDEYLKHPNAGIIAFVVDNEDESKRKKILKSGRVGYLKSMKLQSVQITFKRDVIIDKDITFDEKFGTGTKLYCGEENIFLFDCIRKNIKIHYSSKKIATLRTGDSSWERRTDRNNAIIRGMIYYRMTKKFYPLLILQFAFRKRRSFKNDMSVIEHIKYMLLGAKKYRSGQYDI